ncbi:hypothetical protein EDC27_3138 [Desulfosoma caldarium]|uniref:Uncharacterized protein n=1 Tax=Desulfosoma caldarium TaxID=610254 RepID=A0A3N1UP00_9BACT|nr:hypothetical protein EDC27_3138 [Desulfosoma caldarium]
MKPLRMLSLWAGPMVRGAPRRCAPFFELFPWNNDKEKENGGLRPESGDAEITERSR